MEQFRYLLNLNAQRSFRKMSKRKREKRPARDGGGSMLLGRAALCSVHSRIPRRKFRETIHVIKPIEKSVSLFTQGGRAVGGVAAGRSRGENDPQTRRHPFRHRLRCLHAWRTLLGRKFYNKGRLAWSLCASSLPGTVLRRIQRRELY